MYASRGRNFIFVHIPKTGGTSLALALERRAMKDDIMLGDTPKARRRRHRVRGIKSSGRLWKHSRLIDLYGLLDEEEINDFFVFTIVRNPWDRMVSYYHWLKDQDFEHVAVTQAKALSFQDFIRHPAVSMSMRAMPYSHYVTDRKRVERCDMFLRLESIDSDVERLEKVLGIPIGPVPHENRSDRSLDYREAYSFDDQRFVAEICAEDIRRFGYSF